MGRILPFAIKFTTEQLNLRVDKVDGSIWLSDQLQFYENKILAEIVPYALGIMLIIEVLFYILFSLKNKVLSITSRNSNIFL